MVKSVRKRERYRDDEWLRARTGWLVAGMRGAALRHAVQLLEASIERRSKMNSVILLGTVSDEPRFGDTATGSQVCNLKLCTTERTVKPDGERKDYQTWHAIVAWGKVAAALEGVKPGDWVSVVGRLQNRSYVDNGGNKRYVTEVVASTAEILRGLGGQQQQASATDDGELPF